MSVIWRKVWFDLWHNKARTLLAVLSIAVGVFAIGAIFGMVDQLLPGMDRSHQASQPSHISMTLSDRISRETADRLTNIAGVDDIEVANTVSIRYKAEPDDEWQAGFLQMRADYDEQLYDVLRLQAGRWPDNNNLAIERLSSEAFGLDLGDEVIFEMDQTDRALPITGKIRSAFVHPPQFGGPAVFYTDAAGLERFNIPAGEFGLLLIRVTPYRPDLAREVASEIKDRLGKEGVGVAFTTYQDPAEHWGRMFLEGLTVVLRVLAVIALLMSVVLVTNTMAALITQQINQIGMIKALGGSTGTILTLYLATVLIYGLLAFTLALPLGALVAFGLSQWFLNAFNIDYDTFQVSFRAIGYQAVAATLIPALAALWPVLTGATMTVRAAIATYGLGGDFGSNRLDRAIEQLGSRIFSSPYAIALGNMFRRKGRLILTQLALIGAGTMFLIVMALSSSLTYTLDTDLNRHRYDLHLGFEEAQAANRVMSMLRGVPGVGEAELWFTAPAAVLKEGQRLQEAGVGAEIIGLPAASDYYRPLLIAGRWFQPGDGQVIVISQDLADDHQLHLGDTLTLNMFELGDGRWQVIGIFEVIFSDGFGTTPLYAPLEAVAAATKQYKEGTRLLVRTTRNDPAGVEAIFTQLKNLYEARNMDTNVYTSGTTFQTRAEALSQFSFITTMLLALAIIVALVGGIGLMGSLSINVIERTREIGVMRAIGARSRAVMGMFMLEGILQGLLSWVVSGLLSFALFRPMANALGYAMFGANLDYRYDTGAVFIWLLVILLISTLASLMPALNATRVSVRESLAYV
ncbi:MAG TPA: FtsX-like permease family protein [Anaerolineae bacterium]|nr:FtsX-like permease family protein [Anaerolineae bacterium]